MLSNIKTKHMKKLILAAALFTLGLSMEAKTVSTENASITVNDPKWMKSEAGTWMGASKTWYKLNTKDATVWMSKDGKNWELKKDGIWQDKEGKWLKIAEMDLKWSSDGGKTWDSVQDWEWQGTDGRRYKFDKDWSLWVA